MPGSTLASAKAKLELAQSELARAQTLLDAPHDVDQLARNEMIGANHGAHVEERIVTTGETVGDRIEITHRARGRDGFARGAVLAAELVRGKKGLFRFDELVMT